MTRQAEAVQVEGKDHAPRAQACPPARQSVALPTARRPGGALRGRGVRCYTGSSRCRAYGDGGDVKKMAGLLLAGLMSAALGRSEPALMRTDPAPPRGPSQTSHGSSAFGNGARKPQTIPHFPTRWRPTPLFATGRISWGPAHDGTTAETKLCDGLDPPRHEEPDPLLVWATAPRRELRRPLSPRSPHHPFPAHTQR